MSKNISILGSGIIGLCAGYHLLKKGYKVTFFDKNDPGSGASYGNAGSFSNYGAVGLNQPSIINNFSRYLFNTNSSISVQWNYLFKLLPWSFKFLKNCNEKSMRDTAKKMNDLLILSLSEYEKIFLDIGAENLIRRNGVIYIYNNSEDPKVKDSIKVREELEIKQSILSKSEVHDLEPKLNTIYEGGVFFPTSLHTTNPKKISEKIFQKCLELGASFVKNEVRSVSHNKIQSSIEEYAFDKLLIAVGSFSKQFANQIGEKIPLETERGYHIHFKGCEHLITRPVCSFDTGIYLTPMEQGLRAAGTVEFGGLLNPLNKKKIHYITKEAKKLISNLPDPYDSWLGFRPTLPDFLPVIGESKNYKNIFYAFGHNHLGWTLGAITGSIISKMISKEGYALNFSQFSSKRFS